MIFSLPTTARAETTRRTASFPSHSPLPSEGSTPLDICSSRIHWQLGISPGGLSCFEKKQRLRSANARPPDNHAGQSYALIT